MSAHPSDRFAARAGAAACVFLLATGLLSACSTSDLLTVQAPSSIPAGEFEGNPTNALPIVNGAVADFECAFGAYAVLGGETGEELDDATQTAARYPYDRRNAQSTDTQYASSGCEALGVYTPLQTARATNNNARRLLAGWTDAQVPDRATLIARTLLYEAYSMLLLGEGFCSTTFTTYDGSGNPVYHPELTRTQAFTEAEARFTEALTAAQAAGATEIVNAARVGRARTRLDLGDKSGARGDAIVVPVGFEFDVTADVANTRRQNRAYSQSNPSSSAVTVGARYRTLNDPRVPVVDQGRRNVNQVPIWTQLKFPKPESPVALASYKEAQLIVAEADIASNPANTVAIINAARGRGNQGPYLGALTPAALLLEVIDQRRRELYLESQHLGDLIRYGIAPAPAAGSPYPGGGTYGTQLCLPLPDVERLNNPVIGS